jgi:hypothetical protein
VNVAYDACEPSHARDHPNRTVLLCFGVILVFIAVWLATMAPRASTALTLADLAAYRICFCLQAAVPREGALSCG